MADITMCKGGACTLKHTCYRFLATEEKVDQTYFGIPPFEETNDQVKCKFYWNVEPESDD